MSRFKIYLEYDGTRYSGWQKQPNARTIQGMLLKVAEEIFGKTKIDNPEKCPDNEDNNQH